MKVLSKIIELFNNTKTIDININDNSKIPYEEILINTHQLQECMKKISQ